MTNSKFARPLFCSMKKFKVFSISLLFALSLWQCVSAPDFLGGEILPDDDFFRVKTDTSFQLSAYTQAYDSLNTAGFTLAMLGETFDPIFGKSRASFLTQLYLGWLDHSFGTNPTVDSAFLVLYLNDKLGNEPIEIGVFELADSLVANTAYNGLANIDHLISNIEIGTSATPYTGEEVKLKIPISNDWILNRIINPSLEDSTIMSSQTNFVKHLPGIYLAPKNTFASYAKGMYAFNYTSLESKLLIYYKNDAVLEDEKNENYNFSLVFSTYNARFNHFEHDHSLADPAIAVNFNTPENSQDTVLYVKGLGSVRSEIFLDDITKWIEKMPVSINRAELRIELEDHNQMPADTLLNQLLLYTLEDNQRMNLIDRSINEERFGGKYSKSKKYYSFNITYHLQSLLNDPSLKRSIIVEPRYAYNSAEGAVLRSSAHSQPMKLIITYTKF